MYISYTGSCMTWKEVQTFTVKGSDHGVDILLTVKIFVQLYSPNISLHLVHLVYVFEVFWGPIFIRLLYFFLLHIYFWWMIKKALYAYMHCLISVIWFSIKTRKKLSFTHSLFLTYWQQLSADVASLFFFLGMFNVFNLISGRLITLGIYRN